MTSFPRERLSFLVSGGNGKVRPNQDIPVSTLHLFFEAGWNLCDFFMTDPWFIFAVFLTNLCGFANFGRAWRALLGTVLRRVSNGSRLYVVERL